MTGLFLIAVVGLWLWFSVFLARLLLRSMQPRPIRWLVVPLVFFAQLSLPVADEIVGGFQFRALCDKNAVFRMGVEHPEGRTTRVTRDPSNEIVPGTAITIYHSGFKYTDVQTGEIVVEFDSYVAEGGVFIRTLGISESNSPLTMDRSSCTPKRVRNEPVQKTFKFSVTN